MRLALPLTLLVTGALAACRGAPAPPLGTAPDAGKAGAPAESSVTTTSAIAALGPTGSTAVSASKLRGRTPPKAGEMIDLEAQTFATGSTPGDVGRDPAIEPALIPATLNAFAIDALPYPNDPALPPKTGVTRPDAQKLCEARGERLCSELEWEHACKGPEGDLFASGSAWDPACEKEPTTCASGFGVRSMGAMREWTASHVFPTSELALAPPAVRGPGRCAQRGRQNESKAQADLTFRCCKGAANPAQIAAIQARPAFRATNLDAAAVSKIFATVPELSRLGTDIRLYDEGDVKNITARSGAKSDGVTFATSPILWSPENGAELLVFTGRGKSAAFIVALYTLPNEKYRLASSFLLLNDLSPVALAWDSRHRQELYWSACWGCAGEQGSVHVHDDHHVVIVQH